MSRKAVWTEADALGRAALPALSRAAAGSFMHRVLAFLVLTKPRVAVLLVFTGVVAAWVAAGPALPLWRTGLFAVLAAMAAGGAACFNHLMERDVDARMTRTRRRPLPSGRVSPAGARIFAVSLLAPSVPAAYAAFGWPVALQLALGAAIYVLVYTRWLKRTTAWNIVIGGAAGSCMVLAGWLAAGQGLGTGAWLLALVVFLWTPPHFWSLAVARDADYRAAGIPMLPQVAGVRWTARAMAGYAGATWAASLAVAAAVPLGHLYLITAAVAGGGFTAGYLWFWVRPSQALAAHLFKASGLYLLLVFVAALVDVLA